MHLLRHARKPVKSGRCLVTASFGYGSWCTNLEYDVLSVHFAGHANMHYKLDTLVTIADAIRRAFSVARSFEG